MVLHLQTLGISLAHINVAIAQRLIKLNNPEFTTLSRNLADEIEYIVTNASLVAQGLILQLNCTWKLLAIELIHCEQTISLRKQIIAKEGLELNLSETTNDVLVKMQKSLTDKVRPQIISNYINGVVDFLQSHSLKS